MAWKAHFDRLTHVTRKHLAEHVVEISPGIADTLLQRKAPHELSFERGADSMDWIEQEQRSGSKWEDPRATGNFRILSLDGGGVRGILVAVLLQRLQREIPELLNNVDMIAGTSTGGVLALLLASGYSPKQCQELYAWGCPHIFERSIFRRFNPFCAKYSSDNREQFLRRYLGSRSMADLRMPTLITSFKLDGRSPSNSAPTFFDRKHVGGWRPALLSNIPVAAGKVPPDSDLLAWEAAMRTSAAPVVFPIHNGYCDGGVFANNPALLAVCKATSHYPAVTNSNISVLSIGAGWWRNSVDFKGNFDWGLKQWLNAANVLYEGPQITTELMMGYVLGGGKRYHRLDPLFDHAIHLDDVKSLEELVDIANSVDLTSSIRFAKKHFSKKGPTTPPPATTTTTSTSPPP